MVFVTNINVKLSTTKSAVLFNMFCVTRRFMKTLTTFLRTFMVFFTTKNFVTRYTYHVSDFNNKFKLKTEQRPLVVCPDHNLTSKIGDHVLTEELKMLIAQIKAAKEEQIKEQILNEVMGNSKIANNDSEEYENLRMENYLLKDLNAELTDKNVILK